MIVIKVGGGAGVDLESVCADIAAVATGQQVVVVHGTSAAADALAIRMGVPARTIQSPSGYVSRYTDAETLDVFTMAAVGQVNTNIVMRLQGLGVNAVGLSGLDGRLIGAKRKDAVRAIDPETGRQRIGRYDFNGKFDQINWQMLHVLLISGYKHL